MLFIELDAFQYNIEKTCIKVMIKQCGYGTNKDCCVSEKNLVMTKFFITLNLFY